MCLDISHLSISAFFFKSSRSSAFGGAAAAAAAVLLLSLETSMYSSKNVLQGSELLSHRKREEWGGEEKSCCVLRRAQSWQSLSRPVKVPERILCTYSEFLISNRRPLSPYHRIGCWERKKEKKVSLQGSHLSISTFSIVA